MNERSTKTEKTNEIALLSQSKNEGNENKKVKGKWKGDYGKKQQFRDGWKTHYEQSSSIQRWEISNSRGGSNSGRGRGKKDKRTFNVIIIKNGAILLVNMLLQW